MRLRQPDAPLHARGTAYVLAVSMVQDEEHEATQPFVADSDSSLASDSDDDVNPITMMATRQISRSVSQAQQEDDTPSKLWPAFHKFWAQFKEQFYPSWLLDHLDLATLKTTSRTWIHCWFTILMICIQPCLKWEGGASYLATIIALVQPSGGESVIHCAIDSFWILFMTTQGYLGSIIVMAINSRIRGNLSVSEVRNLIFESGECAMGDSRCVSEALLDGRYVSARTNVVMAFGYFFTTLSLLAFNIYPPMLPMFRVPVIIGIISGTINLVNTNHVPYFNPWAVAKNIFLPTFVALASRVFLALVWFPSSSSKIVMNRVEGQFTRIANTVLKLFEDISNESVGSDKFPELAEKFGTDFHASPVFWMVLGIDQPLIKYEPVYSRLDPEDIDEYALFVRRLASVQSTFTFFFSEFLDYRRTIIENLAREQQREGDGDNIQRRESCRSSTARSSGVHPLQNFPTRKPTFGHELRHRREKSTRLPWLNKKLNKQYLDIGNFEKNYSADLRDHRNTFQRIDTVDAIYNLILSHYRPIIDTANHASKLASEWLREANKFRVAALVFPSYRKKRMQRQKEYALKMQDMIKDLEDAYVKIKDGTQWLHIALQKYPDFTEHQQLYALSQDMFFGYLVEQSVLMSRKICRWCTFLDDTRPVACFMWPFQYRKDANKRETVVRHYESEHFNKIIRELEPSDDTKRFQPVRTTQRRNPDSTPPRNAFHLFGTALLRYKAYLLSDEGLFVIKKASIGLVPIILYMNRPTLRFAYGYRVVWVCIMATLTASPRAGDCVYSLLIRFFMTILGGVTGMVCWYISAGNGKGNPYGLGATNGVALIFIVYFRHFSMLGGPSPAPRIVFCITWTLVVCVSYMDHKLPTPGLKLTNGYNVFWIRFVCVIIGLVIGFLATTLPKANTTKKTVRRQISALIKSLGDIQATLVNFGLQRYDDEHVHQQIFHDSIMLKVNGAVRGLAGLKMNMSMLRFEPPLTGFWPLSHYTLLSKMINEVLYLQTLFYAVLNGVPGSDDIMKTLEVMGMLDSNLLAGLFSVVYMTSNSIQFGEPLPTITHGHLTKDYMKLLRQVQTYHHEKPEDFLREMTKTRMGRTLLISSHCSELFFRRIDGILVLLKGLCGEAYDFDPRVNNYIDHEF